MVNAGRATRLATWRTSPRQIEHIVLTSIWIIIRPSIIVRVRQRHIVTWVTYRLTEYKRGQNNKLTTNRWKTNISGWRGHRFNPRRIGWCPPDLGGSALFSGVPPPFRQAPLNSWHSGSTRPQFGELCSHCFLLECPTHRFLSDTATGDISPGLVGAVLLLQRLIVPHLPGFAIRVFHDPKWTALPSFWAPIALIWSHSFTWLQINYATWGGILSEDPIFWLISLESNYLIWRRFGNSIINLKSKMKNSPPCRALINFKLVNPNLSPSLLISSKYVVLCETLC
jgi:hypothetical protein